MESKFKSLKINKFMGIKNLNLSSLFPINVVVGENNCGKTSLLEAILLFRNLSFVNYLKTTLIRGDLSYYTNFIYSFPIDEKNVKEISLECTFYDDSFCTIKVSGTIEETLLKELILKDDTMKYTDNFIKIKKGNETTNQFNGEYIANLDGNLFKESINANPFIGLEVNSLNEKNNCAKINYFHSENTLNENSIYVSGPYKNITLNLLKIFDKRVDDILILKNAFNQPEEFLSLKDFGILPLANFGDGVKKALAIAKNIAASKDGILLIDEFENGIHVENYKDIFTFLIKAAKVYNVQLFITTHSLEAIDVLLENDDDVLESIGFITLKKDKSNGNTLNRTLKANDVKLNRKSFDFEVRI